jgi:hypothetical protein
MFGAVYKHNNNNCRCNRTHLRRCGCWLYQKSGLGRLGYYFKVFKEEWRCYLATLCLREHPVFTIQCYFKHEFINDRTATRNSSWHLPYISEEPWSREKRDADSILESNLTCMVVSNLSFPIGSRQSGTRIQIESRNTQNQIRRTIIYCHKTSAALAATIHF